MDQSRVLFSDGTNICWGGVGNHTGWLSRELWISFDGMREDDLLSQYPGGKRCTRNRSQLLRKPNQSHYREHYAKRMDVTSVSTLIYCIYEL